MQCTILTATDVATMQASINSFLASLNSSGQNGTIDFITSCEGTVGGSNSIKVIIIYSVDSQIYVDR